MARAVGHGRCSSVSMAAGLGCLLALVLGGCGARQPGGSAGLSRDPSVDSPGAGGSHRQGGAGAGGAGGAAGGSGGTAAPQDGGTSRRTPPAIRLLAPLSGSIDDSLRPDFRWAGGPGTVDICRDRACQQIVASVTGAAGEARPGAPLPSGTLFWRVVTSQGPTATWQITIPHRESGRAIAFGSIPDYNGDGLADVTLTAQDGTGVDIFFGSKTLPAQGPDVTLTGVDAFGCAVATVGDVNGDGFADLGVAQNCVDGPVRIFHGGAAGLVLGATLDSGHQFTRFGQTMASAGDVNGDGYGDVIVGGGGAAQVFLGGPDGVSTSPLLELTSAGGAATVQGPGDVNGDGLPDVSVGAAADVIPGDLFLGNGAGFTRQVLTFPAGGGNSFAGDFNGDGFVDFDSFSVLAGTPQGLDPTRRLASQATMPIYAAAGDIDADGFADQIELVASVLDLPEHYRILFGTPSPCEGTCRSVPLIPPGLTPFEFAILAGVGDVNGDGFDDLVVSRPSIGTAYLYLGGAGFPGSPARTWTGHRFFGDSVAALFGTATFFGQFH